eukprot:5449246-Alexandrium_andersonii.AAC.1
MGEGSSGDSRKGAPLCPLRAPRIPWRGICGQGGGAEGSEVPPASSPGHPPIDHGMYSGAPSPSCAQAVSGYAIDADTRPAPLLPWVMLGRNR